MTGDDRVNLAVAAIARANKVNYVLSLVHDSEQISAFHDLGVRTLDLNALLARTMVHYLQDPRIGVTPLSHGSTEIFEVDVGATFIAIGKRVKEIQGEAWKIVGILRENDLIFPQPDTLILEQDRLLILGEPDLFQNVCTLLECGRPRFPMAYGQRLALALSEKHKNQKDRCVQEAVHLGRDLGLESMDVLCEGPDKPEPLEHETMEIEQQSLKSKIRSSLPDMCSHRHVALAILPGVKPSWLDFFRSPRLIKLAHNLPCPLLMARGSSPYSSILVPFDGSGESELALETAFDMAKQLDAKITVMFVQEPEFLHQEHGPDQKSHQDVMDEARQIAHIHKVSMQELIVTGNVVREVIARSAEFDLLVLGSKSSEREWLRPHVGELIMRRAKCSVLLTVLGHIPPPANVKGGSYGT
jgi:nucleotide-binding universal stress UspA family protein